MSERKSVNAQMSDRERALFSEDIAHQASFEVEQEVPHWHREQAFEQHFKTDDKTHSRNSTSWGLWLGVPALSMACSAFAITVVLSFMHDKGLEQPIQQKLTGQLASQPVSQSSRYADIEALINLKLREFAAEQQVILANYRADMTAQQQQDNLSLASYVIGASRKERQEDISDFINFINAQREDEQLTQKIKFQQLEREIGFQKLGLDQTNTKQGNLATPINYQG